MKKELKICFEEIESREQLDAGDRALFDAALEAREKAYAGYSNFYVGCALLLENGQIITGSNQENAAYPSGLCAERTAVFWTSANFPNLKIKKIFVVGAPKDRANSVPVPPCGACRQAILEYEVKQKAGIELYFAAPEGRIFKTESVQSLLPFSFDASYL